MPILTQPGQQISSISAASIDIVQYLICNQVVSTR